MEEQYICICTHIDAYIYMTIHDLSLLRVNHTLHVIEQNETTFLAISIFAFLLRENKCMVWIVDISHNVQYNLDSKELWGNYVLIIAKAISQL